MPRSNIMPNTIKTLLFTFEKNGFMDENEFQIRVCYTHSKVNGINNNKRDCGK